MNKDEILSYQRRHIKYLRMLNGGNVENSRNDMIDNYVISHNDMLEELEYKVDVVLTDKQLDAIVKKLVEKII